jgi:hypothetical protein
MTTEYVARRTSFPIWSGLINDESSGDIVIPIGICIFLNEYRFWSVLAL